jgi:hypothetical protein
MADGQWQKSSYSSGDPSSDCIEVAADSGGGVYVRESEDPSTALTTSPTRLAALLCALRAPVASS